MSSILKLTQEQAFHIIITKSLSMGYEILLSMPINIYPSIGGELTMELVEYIGGGFGDLLRDYIGSEEYVAQKQEE